MGILLEEKDSPDSLTKDDNFINAKNRGGLYKVFAGVFFLLLRNFLDLMFQTRKERLMLNK